jgi:hypothetical protein
LIRVQSVTILLARSMGGFTADAVLEEIGVDEMVITDHPVEEGSSISDHAYKLPSEITLTYVWSDGGKQNAGQDPGFLRSIYSQILQLQIDKNPFEIYTGKRAYKNMLLQSLRCPTDQKTNFVLYVQMHCREVLMASTQTVSVTSDASKHLIPAKTAPVVNQGNTNLQPAPNWRP